MHHKVWLLVNMNNTQEKDVVNKFKANKMDIIEYDQIIVPIHVNNNHRKLKIIDLYENYGLQNFHKFVVILKLNYYIFFCYYFTGVYLSYILVLIQYYVMIL